MKVLHQHQQILSLVRAHFPVLTLTVSPYCRKEGVLWASFTRTFMPLLRTPSSRPNNCPESSRLLTPSLGELGFPQMNFGGKVWRRTAGYNRAQEFEITHWGRGAIGRWQCTQHGGRTDGGRTGVEITASYDQTQLPKLMTLKGLWLVLCSLH